MSPCSRAGLQMGVDAMTLFQCSPARESLCENGNVWPLADDLME